MHTIPRSYLAAFADLSAPREKPHVWRFERQSNVPKLISLRDISVKRDIYTLWTEDGQPDLSIEMRVLAEGVEDGFSNLIASLEAGKQPPYWRCRQLSRFMAFQLLRTPRSFQIFRDACALNDVNVGPNDPQRLTVYMAPQIENWICQMSWYVSSNVTSLPFLTSDNPVTAYAETGLIAEVGVGFSNPALRVIFPLSPRICLVMEHTPASLFCVTSDSSEREPSFMHEFELLIHSAELTLLDVIRLNQVTNAEKYAYTNGENERIRLFMKEQFTDRSAPVRRDDGQPVGSARKPSERS